MCVCDSRDGLAEQFWCCDRLHGSVDGGSNPKYRRTAYLWGGYRDGLAFVLLSWLSSIPTINIWVILPMWLIHGLGNRHLFHMC